MSTRTNQRSQPGGTAFPMTAIVPLTYLPTIAVVYPAACSQTGRVLSAVGWSVL